MGLSSDDVILDDDFLFGEVEEKTESKFDKIRENLKNTNIDIDDALLLEENEDEESKLSNNKKDTDTKNEKNRNTKRKPGNPLLNSYKMSGDLDDLANMEKSLMEDSEAESNMGSTPTKYIPEEEEYDEDEVIEEVTTSDPYIREIEKTLGVEFSEEQREVIFHRGTPLNVLSGAGSGKTTVLVAKMLYREYAHGVKPLNMLGISFSARSTEEMKERYLSARRNLGLKGKGKGLPTFRTFHSLFLMLLKTMKDYKKVDVMEGNRFKFELTNLVEGREDMDKSSMLDEMFSFRGKLINHGISMDGITGAKENFSDEFSFTVNNYIRVMEKYQNLKELAGVIDFDDMQTIIYNEIVNNKNNEPVDAFRRVWGDGDVYIDEYQDISEIQRTIMDHLIQDFNRFTVIGDDDQCWQEDSLVKTEKGVKPIKDVQVGDKVYTMKNGKPTYSAVTHKSDKMRKDTVVIHTKQGKRIEVTYDHKLFSTKPPFDKSLYYVYLMYRKDKGFRLGILTGGLYGTINSRKHSERPDRLWLVGQYHTRKEATLVEETYSLKYQIPTNPYLSNGRGMALDQDGLDTIFDSFGSKGWKLLKDLRYQFDYPHYIPRGVTRNNVERKNVNLVMNTNKGGNQISFEQGGVRIRRWISNYKDAREFAESVADKYDANIIYEKYAFEKRTYLDVIPANQLMVGMKIPIILNGEHVLDAIESITSTNKEESVYHLEVADTGILITDDIVSHNSIYKFRGSNPQYIIDFPYLYNKSTRLHLTTNYRCKGNILKPVLSSIEKNNNRVYKDIKPFQDGGTIEYIPLGNNMKPLMDAILEEVEGFEGEMYQDVAILVRKNAQRMLLTDSLIEAGIPVNINNIKFSLQNNKVYKTIMGIIEMIQEEDNDLFIKYARILFPHVKKVETEKYIYEDKNWYEDFINMGYYGVSSDKIELIRGIKDTNNMRNAIIYVWKLVKGYYVRLASRGFGVLANTERIVKYLLTISKGLTIKEFIGTESHKYARLKLWCGSDEALRIDTLHSVKGLEFDVVYLVGLSGDVFPDENRYNSYLKKKGWGKATEFLEEERRLFYVGWTRAKERLVVSYDAQNPSRFLQEVEGFESNGE